MNKIIEFSLAEVELEALRLSGKEMVKDLTDAEKGKALIRLTEQASLLQGP